ncbi:hypothetical protein ACFLZZ_00565 [Nanoarchaeota archaeon]
MVEELENLAKNTKWNSLRDMERGTYLRMYAVQDGRDIDDSGYFKEFRDTERGSLVILAKDREELKSLPDTGIHIKKDDYVNHDILSKKKNPVLKHIKSTKGIGLRVIVAPRLAIRYIPLKEDPNYKKNYGRNGEDEKICLDIGGTD